MTILQTIAVAFAMFSALPVPQFEWNEKNMRYAMCALSLIHILRAEEDSMLFRAGEHFPIHEFHHWDSTANEIGRAHV